jgi:hypothetical protein
VPALNHQNMLTIEHGLVPLVDHFLDLDHPATEKLTLPRFSTVLRT